MTVALWLRQAAQALRQAGVASPVLDAELLLAETLGTDRLALLTESARALTPAERSRGETLLRARLARKPLAQILGRQEFWSLPLAVSPDTLIPRPDSETLVDAALRDRPDRTHALRLLDLGTGTGALLFALLVDLPNAHGVGTDLSDAALTVAQTNAAALGLATRCRFVQGDWTAGLGGEEPFDLIVSNPPYLSAADWQAAIPEVRDHEPRIALVGGEDGLAAYRALAAQLGPFCAADARLYLEMGATQSEPVKKIFQAQGFHFAALHQDLAGRPRVLVFAAPGS